MKSIFKYIIKSNFKKTYAPKVFLPCLVLSRFKAELHGGVQCRLNTYVTSSLPGQQRVAHRHFTNILERTP